MKTLYTFKLNKLKEVEKVETKSENGVETTVKHKETVEVPIEFAIKKPSRTEKDEAEATRAEYLSQYLRRGIISEAVLSKIYSDQKGILDEAEKKYYEGVVEDFRLTSENYKLMSKEERDSEKGKVVLSSLVDLKYKIEDFLRRQNMYFENTAESMARVKHIEFFLTQLTYTREDETKEFEPYFKGADFEAKMLFGDQLEEKDEALFSTARNKVLFVLSAMIHSNAELSKERIDELLIEAKM